MTFLFFIGNCWEEVAFYFVRSCFNIRVLVVVWEVFVVFCIFVFYLDFWDLRVGGGMVSG